MSVYFFFLLGFFAVRGIRRKCSCGNLTDAASDATPPRCCSEALEKDERSKLDHGEGMPKIVEVTTLKHKGIGFCHSHRLPYLFLSLPPPPLPTPPPLSLSCLPEGSLEQTNQKEEK